jgi:hypothetical protein
MSGGCGGLSTLIDTAQSPWLVPFCLLSNGYLLAYGEVTPTNTLFGLPFTLLLANTA